MLDWQPCADPGQRGFDCATAQAPLDYSDPQGATIELAVIRHLATDPANRLGTFFFNPGGPGGPGTLQLPQWLGLFPATLRARFDLISWDPRGVGASTAVRCFATSEDEQKFFAGLPDGFPVGRAEQRAWISLYARFGLRCAESNGDLLAHVSTTDTANDLDLLRQAVGDPQLNFLGLSYGTFLGATYANLFPDKVRTMVLDGNADPVMYTNGATTTPLLAYSSASGRMRAPPRRWMPSSRFAAKRPPPAVPSPTAAATKAKWRTLLRRLRAHPVTVGSPPRTWTYAALATYIGSESATGTGPQLAIVADSTPGRGAAGDPMECQSGALGLGEQGRAGDPPSSPSRAAQRGAVRGEPQPAPPRRLPSARRAILCSCGRCWSGLCMGK